MVRVVLVGMLVDTIAKGNDVDSVVNIALCRALHIGNIMDITHTPEPCRPVSSPAMTATLVDVRQAMRTAMTSRSAGC